MSVDFLNSSEPSEQLKELTTRVEVALDRFLPANDSTQLSEAMRYSTLNGGKRLRALLTYASGITLGADIKALDYPASAVECVHAYSLIHDDLPAMDDDDLRRGKPTCHIKFDEATAILAGDALQAFAFELLTEKNCPHLSPSQQSSLCLNLAKAGGATGMAGGQMLDIAATNVKLNMQQLEAVHRAKTGALIEAAVLMGAKCKADVTKETLDALSNYALNIGLAFQIIDDVLDETSDTQTLGKQIGADKALGKSTYPALIGIEGSRKAAQDLYNSALGFLDGLGDNTALLKELANKVINRIN